VTTFAVAGAIRDSDIIGLNTISIYVHDCVMLGASGTHLGNPGSFFVLCGSLNH
jgi:hypothetical protein